MNSWDGWCSGWASYECLCGGESRDVYVVFGQECRE